MEIVSSNATDNSFFWKEVRFQLRLSLSTFLSLENLCTEPTIFPFNMYFLIFSISMLTLCEFFATSPSLLSHFTITFQPLFRHFYITSPWLFRHVFTTFPSLLYHFSTSFLQSTKIEFNFVVTLWVSNCTTEHFSHKINNNNVTTDLLYSPILFHSSYMNIVFFYFTLIHLLFLFSVPSSLWLNSAHVYIFFTMSI